MVIKYKNAVLWYYICNEFDGFAKSTGKLTNLRKWSGGIVRTMDTNGTILFSRNDDTGYDWYCIAVSYDYDIVPYQK